MPFDVEWPNRLLIFSMGNVSFLISCLKYLGNCILWELPLIRKCLFIDVSQTTCSNKCYLSLWKPKITNGIVLSIKHSVSYGDKLYPDWVQFTQIFMGHLWSKGLWVLCLMTTFLLTKPERSLKGESKRKRYQFVWIMSL